MSPLPTAALHLDSRATAGLLLAAVAATLALTALPALAAEPAAKVAVAAPRPAPAAPPAAPASPPAPSPNPGPLGCLIDAAAVAEVGTPVVGVIESVAVERGQLVRRGQVLAQHDSRIERAALELAEARVANTADLRAAQSQVEFARRKAERAQALARDELVSGQAQEQAATEAELARMKLAQAEEQQAMAQRELEMARAQLAQRTILSPLDGVVIDRLVSPGERVENRPVFKIAQLDPLRVEVVLPAALYGSIKPGGSAQVLPELPGATRRTARVTIVDRVVDAGSNTFRARLALPNPGQGLPSGLRCKVEFGT